MADQKMERQARRICELEQELCDQTCEVERQAYHICDLEQELRIVKRQLGQFQGRQMDEIAERRRAAMQYYREQYELKHGPIPPTVYNIKGQDTVD